MRSFGSDDGEVDHDRDSASSKGSMKGGHVSMNGGSSFKAGSIVEMQRKVRHVHQWQGQEAYREDSGAWWQRLPEGGQH
eukprot:1152913-Pelagomonas_calceolata.AAC.3